MSTAVPRLSLAATVALLLGAGSARADLMDWSYNWSRAQFAAEANGGTQTGAVELVLPGPDDTGLGVRTFTARSHGADNYSDVAYAFTFRITDTVTGRSHVLAVDGQWDGTVTSDRVNLTNTFTGGSGSQTFDFLGRDLAVTFGFTTTGSSPWDWAGKITASVLDLGEAGGANGGPAGQVAGQTASPEPASLALACLALPTLGLALRRRRRR